MPKTCHIYLHGSGIKEITPRSRCIKIIKLNINMLQGEHKTDLVVPLPNFSLGCRIPFAPSHQNEPPFTYEQPRDSLKTTPFRCFTHKIERRVICVLARKYKASLSRINFGYGRKEENNFSSSKIINCCALQ